MTDDPGEQKQGDESVGTVLVAGTANLGEDLASTVAFFTILILVPAAVGIAVGAVVRAVRS